jgi:hypothetical protein
MKIYRFVPEIGRYAHPWHSVVGRWWPRGIDLGPWMEGADGGSAWGPAHDDGRYPSSPDEFPLSDFPLLSLQLPVISERAAERLGCHPERAAAWPELAARLYPIAIRDQRYYAVQPRLAGGDDNGFVVEASRGIELPGGEIVHYHTRAFDPDRLRGEFFTIPAHEPYAETYVTEAFVDRARAAELTGLGELELVFDGAPIAPHHAPPSPEAFDQPTFRQQLEWELFRDRGYVWSYLEPELRTAFRAAVLGGQLRI